MPTDTADAPFAIRSLIGNAGVASNGEKLVNAITHFYPADLEAAQQKRPNDRLTNDLDRDEVVDIVGDHIDVRDAVVRGGHQRDDDAWVTYAGYDGNGDTVKGAFPYSDLGSSDSEQHVSQHDRLQESDAARDFREAEAKRKAAEPSSAEADALRARVEQLEGQLAEAGGPVAPLSGYDEKTADDIISEVGDADRATAASVLDYEEAQDKPRKTVVAAAEARVQALDDEQAAQDAEVEALRARVAELEQAQPPPAS